MVETTQEGAPPRDHIQIRAGELVKAWRTLRAGRTIGPLSLPVQPYPGLRSFAPTESGLFFGRQTQAEQLGRRFADNNVVLVLGGSGSGKSSLVKAGLLPDLKTIAPLASRLGKWYVAECRPRTNPVEEVSEAFWRDICEPFLADELGRDALAFGFGITIEEPVGPSTTREASRKKFDDLIRKPGSREHKPLLDAYGIHEFANVVIDRLDNRRLEGLRAGPPNLLLFIDQFEEVFDDNKIDAESRDSLFQMIDLARRNRGHGLFVVITMRSEALHRCAEDPRLVDIVNQSSFLLELIDDRDVPDAIVRPARAVLQAWGIVPVGARLTDDRTPFAPSLVTALSKELTRLRASLLHKPDSLPLLQHTLEAIWNEALARWEREIEQGKEVKIEINEEDFNAITKQASQKDSEDYEGVSASPFRRCLDARADARLAAAIDILQRVSGSPRQTAERVLVAAFTTLAHRDDRGNWVRDFATAAEMFATSGVAQMRGVTVPNINESLVPFVQAGYLQEDSKTNEVGEHRRSSIANVYNVGHEALIRSWSWCEQCLRNAERLSELLAGLDRSIAESIGAPSAPPQARTVGALIKRSTVDWFVACWRWLRANREDDAARLLNRERLEELESLIGVEPLYSKKWTIDRLTEHQREFKRRLEIAPEIDVTAAASAPTKDTAQDRYSDIVELAKDANRWLKGAWARLPIAVTGLTLIILGYFGWTELIEKPAQREQRVAAERERDTWVAARQYFAAQSSDRLVESHQIELARLVALNALRETKSISPTESKVSPELVRSVGAIMLARTGGLPLLGTNGSTRLLAIDPKGRFVAAPTMSERERSEQRWEVTNVLGVDPKGRSTHAFVAMDTLRHARNQSIRLWETTAGGIVTSLSGLHGEISAITISPDGEKIAAGSSEGEVLVWNSSGELIAELISGNSAISALAFQKEGMRLIAGTRDNAIWIWDVNEKTAIPGASCKPSAASVPDGSRSPGGQGILSVAVVAGGDRILVAMGGKHLLLLDASSGKCVQQNELKDDATAIVFGSSSSAILATRDRVYGVTLTEHDNNMTVQPLFGGWLPSPLQWISFDAESKRFLVITSNGRIIADELGSAENEPSHQAGAASIRISEFLPTIGYRLVAADPTGRRLVVQADRDDKQPLEFLEKRTDLTRDVNAYTLAVSNDRQYVAVAAKKSVRVIPQGGAREYRLDVDANVDSLDFKPNSNVLAIGLSNGNILIWSFGYNTMAITKFLRHQDDVNRIAFDERGERLVSASDDGKAIIWKVDTGEVLQTLAHPGEVMDASFTADAAEVVTLSRGVIRLWGARTGGLLEASPETGLRSFSLDRLHRRVIGLDRDGVRIWNLHEGNLREGRLEARIPLPETHAALLDSRTGAILTVSRSGRVAVWLIDANGRFTVTGYREVLVTDGRWVGLDAAGTSVLTIDLSGKIQSNLLSDVTGEATRSAFLASPTRELTAGELQQYALPETIHMASTRLQAKTGGSIPCIDPPSRRLISNMVERCIEMVMKNPADGRAWYELARARGSARQNSSPTTAAPDPALAIAAALGNGPALNSLGQWVSNRQPRSFATASAFFTHAVLNDPGAADGYLSWLVHWGDLARRDALQRKDEFSRRASIGDPAAHFILAALDEQAGIDGREQAFLHYAIAAKLFAERGREYSPALVRRSALARILPANRVVARWKEAEEWSPPMGPGSTQYSNSSSWQPAVAGLDLKSEAAMYSLAEQAADALGRTLGPRIDLDIIRGELLLAHAKISVTDDRNGTVLMLEAARSAFEKALSVDAGDAISFGRLDETLALLSITKPPDDCRGPLADRIERLDHWARERASTIMHTIASSDAEIRLGQCLVDRNQLKEARAVLRRALDRLRHMTTPANASPEAKLALRRLTTVGSEILIQADDPQAALEQYSYTLAEFGQELSNLDPTSLSSEQIEQFTDLQRKIVSVLANHSFADPSVKMLDKSEFAVSNVGGRLVSDSNTDRALTLFRDAIKIRTKLIESDSSNTGWQNDILVFQNKIGDILRRKMDRKGALEAYRYGLEKAKTIVKLEPSNTLFQHNLFIMQKRMGDLLFEMRDENTAIAFYQAGIETARTLLATNPSNPDWLNDLSLNHVLIGGALAAIGRYEESIKNYNMAIDVKPTHARAFFARARSYFYLGKLDRAAEDIMRAIELGPSDAYVVIWYHIVHARIGTKDASAKFAELAQKANKDKWPWSVIALYLGMSQPEELSAVAESADDPATRLDQTCEADFYNGIYYLERNNQAEALDLLRSVAATCRGDYFERGAARAELKRLEGTPTLR
jgi:WD40 repeat protein/lipoprotein NlpI/alkylated DNA nucleotide flippase Atl1